MRPNSYIARKITTLLAANAVLLLSLTPALAAEPLRVGMIPDAGATQVSVEEKVPLQKYLEQKQQE